MSYLVRSKKCDLLKIAEELNINLPTNPRVVQLSRLITESEGYNEEIIKDLLERVKTDRENDEEREREREEREREREERREREREERREQREREREEKEREERIFALQLEQQLQLKKIELEAGRNNADISIVSRNNDFLKLMTRFNIDNDISIYLTLFERQINRHNITKEDWVTYLMALLPLEIVNIITREPDPLANDYDHIKSLLLKRFKLSPEQFRQKFALHRKESSSTWRDYAFELKNFFNEWIEGLQVNDYESLKELIVVDQIRRRIPNEIRENLIDDLPKIVKTEELVNKLDDYEATRRTFRRECISREISNSVDSLSVPQNIKSGNEESTDRKKQIYLYHIDVVEKERNLDLNHIEDLSVCNTRQPCKKELTNARTKLKSNISTCDMKIDRSTKKNNTIKRNKSKINMQAINNTQILQYNGIKIMNIPSVENESVINIIKTISKSIDFPLNENTINRCYRIPSRNSKVIPPIILKFNNESDKRGFLSMARKSSEILKTGLLGIEPNKPIFVQELMSPYFYSLFKRAKDLQSRGVLKYVWFRNNELLIKKSHSNKTIQIRYVEDIGALVGDNPQYSRDDLKCWRIV